MFSHQHQIGQVDLCGLKKSILERKLCLLWIRVDMDRQGAELCRGPSVTSCMRGEKPSLHARCVMKAEPPYRPVIRQSHPGVIVPPPLFES